jgi:hypothetical protein
MTTEKDGKINYSCNFHQQAPKGEAPFSTQIPGLWAFDDCAVFSLPRQKLLLKSRRTGNTVVVTPEVAQALQFCRQFKSLDEHVTAVKQANPALAEHQAEIAQVFTRFIQQGFMISAKDLAAKLQRPSLKPRQAPLFGVCIRTCDRPSQLARLLKSFADNEARHGRHYHYRVLDDSRSLENITANQRLVTQIRKDYRLNVYYEGWEQQRQRITALIAAFPEHKFSIQWLLDREEQNKQFSGGRLWNHILLLSAGKRCFTIDDDMICQPYLAPRYRNAFTTSTDQWEACFFLNRQELLQQAVISDLNPIEQHTDVLGYPLAQAAKHFSAVELKEQVFKGLSSDQISSLRADSPILFTQSGVFGDPGTASTTWIYELEEAARTQLVASPELYEKRRASRSLWLGSSSFHFQPTGSLVSTHIGLDNQLMLPCTGPYFRNEDHLFGSLVKALYPTSLALAFPWGLLHLPEPERSWREESLAKPVSVGILGFLADIARNASRQCYAQDSCKRFALLAETYLGLADASNSVLEGGIEENLIHARVLKINQLQSRLDTYQNQPSYWAEDVRRLLRANSNTLLNRNGQLIPDIAPGNERLAQVELVRSTLSRFGEALKIWPLLWEFCKESSIKGHDE